MKKSGNKLIVVLGMHRSGTSVITRGLQVMGVELGDRLMPPLEGNNEKGFWEDIDLNSLNIEMLNFLNSEWHFLTPIQSSDLDVLKENGYLLRAVKMLHGKTSGIPIFGFKDPRTAKLLPFWKEVFAHTQLKVSYVIAVRNPLSVCQSIKERDGFDFEKSYLLWIEHIINSLVGTADENCVLVDFDCLLQSAETELTRVAKILHLELDFAELEKFKIEFLDEGLRHTVYHLNDLALDKTASPIVKEIYEEVLNVAKDITQLDDPTLRKKIAQWNNEFSRQRPALVLADKFTSKMLALDHSLSEGRIQIAHLNQVVIEKEQALTDDNRQIAHLNQAVQALSSQVIELAEIRNSRTWKIALLFRQIRIIVAPPNSFRTRVLRFLLKIIVFPFEGVNQNLETDLDLLRTSDLFDADWYLANNPDVAELKIDPVSHYFLFGGFEGRDPSPGFSSNHYLVTYEDVKKTRVNPLVHYLKHGMTEERAIQPSGATMFLSPQVAEKAQEVQEHNTQEEMIQPVRPDSIIVPQATKVSIVIPTKNAGPLFRDVLEGLKAQEYDGSTEMIVIDSGSTDDTILLAVQYGATVISIPSNEFDHGLTRNRAIEAASGEIVVLMSQDAIPGNQYLIHNFVTAFDDPKVAGAYARQIPREEADMLTKRNLNNWLTGRKTEDVRWIKDWTSYQNLSPMEHFYFCNFDDVCSAIRKSVWQSIPFNANEFGEDIEWAEQVLESGWKIAYWPSSCVIHSHLRSFKYEYDRSNLCHKKLYTLFGIHTVPSWHHMFSSTVTSIKQDWIYAMRHEKRFWTLFKLLVQIPFLSFASVYGQYRGANAGKEKIKQAKKVANDKKMKIILTTHQFIPDYSSGTEILTFETAKELKRLGHDVSVFTAFPASNNVEDTKRFDRYTVDGINVVRFQHNYAPMGDQSNPLEMEYNNRLFGAYFKNYLRRERPDVVHFFHLMRLSASAVDACQELGIPTVLTPTDFWFICPTCQLRLPNNKNCSGPDKSGVNCLRHIVKNNQADNIKAWVQKIPDWLLAVLIFLIKNGISFDTRYSPLIRALSKRREFLLQRLNEINKVVIPTRIMLSMLTQNGLEMGRTISIPFGLNLAHLQNAERSQPGEVLRLGYIGTLSEHKGVHVLVEAVKQLTAKPIELKIYGKLDDFPDYVEKLRKNAQGDSRIKFYGTFPNEEIGTIFSGLDAMVVPSLWYENSPLVVYSAQAARCPIIASNMDGISDIVEHGKNGLLFEAGNVSQLASAIENLLDSKKLLKELSDNSKMPLSIQGYVEELLKIYADLVQLRTTV